jgi:hypothetical protein
MLGDLLVLSWRITNSDVGGTADPALYLALPAGYRVSGQWTGTHRYSDAGGTSDDGVVRANDGNRYVECYKAATANWTLTTGDNTLTVGSILCRVTKD